MILGKNRKTQLKNWFSIYGLLIFICVPIWNTITDIYKNDKNNLIELQKQIEEKIEDASSEKDSLKKHNPTTVYQYSIIENISILAVSIILFKLNNIAFDVVTPPPEHC